jgi:hypothetical protein
MATNDIRKLFTLLGHYDLFVVDLEAEEVFEHREAEELFEHREAEEVFEHRSYVLWKLRIDDEELLFNSSIFEHIT